MSDNCLKSTICPVYFFLKEEYWVLSEGCTTDAKTILMHSHLLYFVARTCGCKFALPGRDVLSLTIPQKTNTPESKLNSILRPSVQLKNHSHLFYHKMLSLN